MAAAVSVGLACHLHRGSLTICARDHLPLSPLAAPGPGAGKAQDVPVLQDRAQELATLVRWVKIAAGRGWSPTSVGDKSYKTQVNSAVALSVIRSVPLHCRA